MPLRLKILFLLTNLQLLVIADNYETSKIGNEDVLFDIVAPIKRFDLDLVEENSDFQKRFDVDLNSLSLRFGKRTRLNEPENDLEDEDDNLPPFDTSVALRDSLKEAVKKYHPENDGPEIKSKGSLLSNKERGRISEMSEARSKVFAAAESREESLSDQDSYLSFDIGKEITKDENTLLEPNAPPTVLHGKTHPQGDNLYRYHLSNEEDGQEVVKYRNPAHFKEFSRTHFSSKNDEDPAEDLDQLLEKRNEAPESAKKDQVSSLTHVLRLLAVITVSLMGTVVGGVMCYHKYRGWQLHRQQELHRRLEFDNPEEALARPPPRTPPEPQMQPGEEAWAQVNEKRRKQERIRYGTRPQSRNLNCDPRRPSGYESDNDETEEEEAYSTPQMHYQSDDPETSGIQEYASGFTQMDGLAIVNPTFTLGDETTSKKSSGNTEGEYDMIEKK